MHVGFGSSRARPGATLQARPPVFARVQQPHPESGRVQQRTNLQYLTRVVQSSMTRVVQQHLTDGDLQLFRSTCASTTSLIRSMHQTKRKQ
jgi:hypothetical protein